MTMRSRSGSVSVDRGRPTGLAPDEQRTVDLAERLRDTGNLQPLSDALRDGQVGPGRARDAQ